jgi:hypothetical protein
MTAYLDAEHATSTSTHSSPPARTAMVQLFIGARTSSNFHQLVVNVHSGEILHQEKLEGCHPHVDADDMQKTEKACLEDPQVKAAIRGLKLPEGAIVKIEPWTYATDDTYDMKEKITMVSQFSVFVSCVYRCRAFTSGGYLSIFLWIVVSSFLFFNITNPFPSSNYRIPIDVYVYDVNSVISTCNSSTTRTPTTTPTH